MVSKGKTAKVTAPGGGAEPEAPVRKMSAFTILGWLVFLSCIIPFSMMPSGRTTTPEMLAGLGLIVAGGVLLAIGHARQNYS